MASAERVFAFEAAAKAAGDQDKAEQAAIDLLAGIEAADVPDVVLALLDAVALVAASAGRERAARWLDRAAIALADDLVDAAVAQVRNYAT